MSEAVMQHGAIAPPTGGRLLRRLNVGTAVAGGLVGGWLAWFLAHHFLQTDERRRGSRAAAYAAGEMTARQYLTARGLPAIRKTVPVMPFAATRAPSRCRAGSG